MIDIIQGLPPDSIGVRLSGSVTSADYEQTLNPAIESALSGVNKINALVVFEDDVDMSAGALWQDTKLGLKHPTAWKRIAIVSQGSWLDRLTPVISAMMPGEIKTFSPDDLEMAKAWLADGGPA